MSERQAKLKRKNEVVLETPKKKKSKLDIFSNIIIIILVLAVLGIGGWAVYSKFSQQAEQNVSEEMTPPTITEQAQTEGISVEEFLSKYEIPADLAITGDSLLTEAIPYMTLKNYATLLNLDIEAVKENMGITKDYPEDTLVSEILDDMVANEEAPAEESTETDE